MSEPNAPGEVPRGGASSIEPASAPFCCGVNRDPARAQPLGNYRSVATDWLETVTGPVPRVTTDLTWRDHLGSLRVRMDIRRMNYRIEPRLYAVGSPGSRSPIFVTANYKLSFDHLRSRLGGIDAWILVLDTDGINVWCAAGKGTFGTDELVRRLEATQLGKIVAHRKLIVPQLGAPGISAHKVKDASGFAVIYGPVRARDIPAFLAAGRKATAEMRRVRFSLWDRMILIPVEMAETAKYGLLVAAGLALLAGLGPGGYSLERMAHDGPFSALVFMGLLLLGVALTPILLPWLPGSAFSTKGAWLGLALGAGMWGVASAHLELSGSRLSIAAWLLFAPAATSFLAMNFTGASTYTSLSGVQKEIARALPLQALAGLIAAGLWVAGRYA